LDDEFNVRAQEFARLTTENQKVRNALDAIQNNTPRGVLTTGTATETVPATGTVPTPAPVPSSTFSSLFGTR